jgi:hypothetical protein
MSVDLSTLTDEQLVDNVLTTAEVTFQRLRQQEPGADENLYLYVAQIFSDGTWRKLGLRLIGPKASEYVSSINKTDHYIEYCTFMVQIGRLRRHYTFACMFSNAKPSQSAKYAVEAICEEIERLWRNRARAQAGLP